MSNDSNDFAARLTTQMETKGFTMSALMKGINQFIAIFIKLL
jgi:hypothetical protein